MDSWHIFFQRHWNICGQEVATVVLRVLNGEDDPALINDILALSLYQIKGGQTSGTWAISADQLM